MLNSAPRKGLTLLEVLITIFVMAIGFLSVLTLFPLAARKLARAIDSDRATLMAGNAAASATILGFRDMAQVALNSELAPLPPQDPRRLQPSTVVHLDPAGVFFWSRHLCWQFPFAGRPESIACQLARMGCQSG